VSENVGSSLEVRRYNHSVHELVLLAVVAISGFWTTSDNVGTSFNEPGMSENVHVAVENSMISHFVHEL